MDINKYFESKYLDAIKKLEDDISLVRAHADVHVPAGVLAFWAALATQNYHAWAVAVAEVGNDLFDAADVWGRQTELMGLSPKINVLLWRGQTPSAVRGITELFPDGASASQIYEWAAGVVQPGTCGMGILAPQPGDRPGIIWHHTTTTGRTQWDLELLRGGGWCVEISTHGSGGQLAKASVDFSADGTSPVCLLWSNPDKTIGASDAFLAAANKAESICAAWCP
jgi:hypothetical protein